MTHILKRFAALHLRPCQKRTYQVIQVPCNVGRNGETKKIDVTVWIDNRLSELNYDLMWTRFLPNPLWPAKGVC